MAGIVVVDTDFVIDFLRGRQPGAALVRDLITSHRLRVTAVTAFELRVGTDFLARHEDIMRLLRSRTYPLDASSALRAGEIAAALQATGQPIGMADCLQAGICVNFELPLATRNRRHFDRVAGLQLFPVPGSAT